MPNALAERPSAAYFAGCHRSPLLTAPEEKALARRARAGDRRARERLIESNLRLVLRIALENRSSRAPLADLVQEGNCGLVRAVDKFDPERGVRLISYAAWWIRAYIRKYLIDSWALMRVGTTQGQRKLFFALSRARRRVPATARDDAELRQASIARMLDVRPKEVAEMELRMSGHELSLDAPIAAGEDMSLLDTLPSEAPSPEARTAEVERRGQERAWLATALKGLSRRERFVARHRLLTDEADTLASLGLRLGVSRERVRQIEAAIKRRLQRRARFAPFTRPA